ncbi:enoyl-CoA hydratase/isomerase family protein [Methylobacterium sp. J-077]|uniref:enoyl-CoA hydratase/isomerase family protein n=1 Tax=Methylobacterium sp. J-077 TaxID=2836656 RepID=UPI001FBB736B|nr:enoyl-CoA hydratase/isomerase family protein [Methylobacterium sp. J-077]MCJ2126640.1 enoyl-CoA hydratase/isomerase family protein [Methylobacterium sp. J-077]
MGGEIRTERSGPSVTLTISQPARRNALTVAMWQDLAAHVLDLAGDDELRCIVIRGGTAEAFSAGADISEFHTSRSTHEQVVRFHEEYVGGCLSAIAECPVPIVAAIQGACFGGGLEIAVACDLRIASRDARFGAPVGRIGFPLALGETEGLFRLVGPSVTAELLIEGRLFDAPTACAKGLVSRVVEVADFEGAIAETVGNICASGIQAARSHKRQIQRLMRDAAPVTYAERMEVYSFAESQEYKHGVQAFLTKALTRNGK